MGKKYYIKREYGLGYRNNVPLIITYYKEREHITIHRENGPAIFAPGYPFEKWFVDNKLHRENGPALIIGNRKEYWLNGKQIKEEEFIWRNCFKNNQ